MNLFSKLTQGVGILALLQTLSVFAVPTPQTITINPASATRYVSDPALTFTVSGQHTAINWTGMSNDNWHGSQNSQAWASSGSYTITAQAQAGRQGEIDYAASNTVSVTITVLPLIPQTISINPAWPINVMPGSNGFSATGTNVGTFSPTWWGAVTKTNASSISFFPTAPGTYTEYAQTPAWGNYAASNIVNTVITVLPAGPSGGSQNTNTGTQSAGFQGGYPSSNNPSVSDGPGGNKPDPKTPDPIQISSGAELASKSLFQLKGARDLEFAVSYDSILASGLTTTGKLGYGWSHPFEAYVTTSGSNLIVHHDATHQNTYAPVTGQVGTFKSAENAARHAVLTANTGGGWTLKHKDQSKWVFNASGQLTQDVDANGRVLNCTYDGTNRLSTVTEPVSSAQLTLAYNTAGLVSTITDSLNNSVTFTYNATPQITKIVNQNGKQTTYTYDSSKQMLTLVNNSGAALATNTYDTLGRAITQKDGVTGHGTLSISYTQANLSANIVNTVTDPAGLVSVYTFDPLRNLLSYKDPLNRTTSYTYDSYSNLLSKTDPLGNTTSYTYDSSANVLTVTDPAGNTTTFTYDSANRLLTAKDPANNITTRTYDAAGNVLTLTDAAGRVTTWTYNSNSLPLTQTLPGGGVNTFAYTNGRLTSLTDPNGVVTTWGYDANGRVGFVKDSLNNQTSYTYDAVGNRLTETNPLSQTTTWTYDDRNRILTKTDAAGAVTTYAYDNNSNVTSVTDALGKVTTFTYDGNDQRLTVTDPLNHVVTNAYNAAGAVTSITGPTGAVIGYTYDAASRVTQVTDPLTNHVNTVYDTRGLLTSVTDPLSRTSSLTWNNLGLKTAATNPLSQTTSFTYDSLNRPVSSIDAGSLTTSQAYSTNGAQASFTNAAGNATSFTTDVGGRVTVITTPGGKVTGYSYDARGLPYVVTLPSGHTTTSSYDAAGRMSGVVDSVGALAITRDAAGRQLTASENGKTLTRAYDLLGRVTSYTDGAGNTIGYSYDDAGNLKTLTYPGAKVVTYGYDAANRLTSVTDWASRVTNYTYDAAGHLTLTHRPNGTTQSRTYDAAGQLTNLTELSANGVTVIYSTDVGYDLAGRVTSEILAPTTGVPVLPTATQTFDVDNRLLTHNGQATSFDLDGNLLTLPGVTPASYTYDARNRLTAAGGLSYNYDSENNRVGLTDATGTTSFVVNPNAALSQMLVRTSPAGVITRYVYGLGLAYEETGSAVRHYHYSRRGDTVALTDAAGAVTDQATYGAYGELLNHTGSSNSPFWFNGLYGVQTDANGLYYHRARYYHPGIRRFLNQDPIGFAGGDNFYAYGEANPIEKVDPKGTTVIITTNGGLTYFANTETELTEVLKKIGPHAITDISIYGHASSIGQSFNRHSSDGLYLTSKGEAVLLSGQTLGDVLKNKLAPSPKIHLGGCETAKNNENGDNITAAVSRQIPGATVSGSTMPTGSRSEWWNIHLGTWFDTRSSIPEEGSGRTYKNGILQ